MALRETDLYGPIKGLLESQGYVVKGEVGAVDVMACRGAEPPVIVELKRAFSLSLVHQGIARQAITDAVYLAVPHHGTRGRKANLALCRRLGLGLMTVRTEDGLVTIHCDPAPFAPRKSRRRTARLLREFARLEGDPNRGGGTRQGLVTAYRQDALRCAEYLSRGGTHRGAEVARATGVLTATRLMRDDHYGWFERVGKGLYRLSDKGLEAQRAWRGALGGPADKDAE